MNSGPVFVGPYPNPGASPFPPPPPIIRPVKRDEPLPVEPRSYFAFYRAPAWRWWKPLAAIALAGVVTTAVAGLAVFGYLAWLIVVGSAVPQDVSKIMTPGLFALNNVVIALTIPIALLVSWLVYRQRPGWLSSIEGRFRWRVFGRFMLIAGPMMIAISAIEFAVSGGIGPVRWTADSLFLILVILFTTPLQAAGEEYLTRGLLGRSVASWFRNPKVGTVIAAAVSSLVFMLSHGAGDVWLNIYYFCFGALFCVLAWWTGGLEAPIAFHLCNNMVGEALLPFSPESLNEIFSRQAGAASPLVLLQMGILLLVVGALMWQSSRLGLRRSTSPAAVIQ